MLETAHLHRGSRVLEIGSGGYNAALIAHLVGQGGAVTSIDIDPAVIDAARTGLDRAGYPQVHVAVADGEYGHLDRAPYDDVIVTVEASDIPPAWTDQLADDGVLVVPLRLRGMTRCLTLRRDGDHLAAVSALQCGFVPMQGDGRNPTRRVALRGDDIVLQLDDDTTTVDAGALIAALCGPRVEVWSPVTAAGDDGAAFEQIHLWLASQPQPFGILTVDRTRTAGLVDPQDRFFCPTLLTDGSFAYLTMRRHDDRWQFGAHGFGPDGHQLAEQMIDHLAVWDRVHRHHGGPRITIQPAAAEPPPADGLQLLVRRRHTLTALTWKGGNQ